MGRRVYRVPAGLGAETEDACVGRAEPQTVGRRSMSEERITAQALVDRGGDAPRAGLEALLDDDALDTARSLLDALIEKGWKPDADTIWELADSFLDAAGRDVDRPTAREAVASADKLCGLAERTGRAVPRRIYHSLIHAYATVRHPRRAEQLLEWMRQQGRRPGRFAIQQVMRGWARVRNGKRAQRAFDRHVKAHADAEIERRWLLIAWANADHANRALRLLKSMDDDGLDPGPPGFGATIAALGRRGDANEAERVAQQMERGGHPRDEFVDAALMEAHARHGDTAAIRAVMSEMEAQGRVIDQRHYHHLVTAALQSGGISAAEAITEEMTQHAVAPAAETAHELIRACIDRDDPGHAATMLRRCRDRGVIPKRRTCTILIDALIEAGLTDQALDIIKDMIDAGPSPRARHITPIVEALSAADHRDAVDELRRHLDDAGLGVSNRDNPRNGRHRPT